MSKLGRDKNVYRYPLRDRLAAAIRRAPVGEIKRCLKLAEQHRIPISGSQLEAHYFAGGRITNVIEAMVFAKENSLDLPLRRALVQDLAYGKTVSVKEWLIDCQRRGVTDLQREPFK